MGTGKSGREPLFKIVAEGILTETKPKAVAQPCDC